MKRDFLVAKCVQHERNSKDTWFCLYIENGSGEMDLRFLDLEHNKILLIRCGDPEILK